MRKFQQRGSSSQIVDPNTNPFSEEWRHFEINQLYIVHPVVTA